MSTNLDLVPKLGRFASEISVATDLESLTETIQHILDEIIDVEYIGLYLIDPKTGKLRMYVAKGFSPEERIKAEETAMDRHVGWVFNSKEKLLVNDTLKDKSGQNRSSERSFIVRSRVWLPVISHGRSVGAFGMASTRPHQFSDFHIALLEFVTNLAGVVYHNILLTIAQKEYEFQLLEALREAEEGRNAKQNFLAKMSHEIRTPMNAIIGIAQLLRRTDLTEVQRSYLNTLYNSSNSLLQLLNDILDFSKLDAGQLDLEATPFSIRQIFDAVSDTFSFKIQEKGLELRQEVDDEIPEFLLGDPLRFTQVLHNLVSNAIKFTSKGHISMQCSFLGKSEGLIRMKMAVSDTGIGIEEKNQDQIFDSFKQEDETTTRKFGGTGLGLSIVREIVDLFGSQIQLDSKKDQGSTFWFQLSLPEAIPEEHDLPQEDGEEEISLAGLHILLVEDDLINQMVGENLLKMKDASVTIAENGKIAVDLVRSQFFDLILMDMQMPEMNGIDASIYIRQHLQKDVPIIALTANASQNDREQCKRAGMDGFQSKPFQIDDLSREILHHVRNRVPK